MQYGCRSLLGLMLIAGLAAGCWSRFVDRPFRREMQTMDELRGIGAVCTSAPRGPWFWRELFGDHWFRRIVQVQRNACTDDERLFSLLKECHHVESLHLTNSRSLKPRDWALLQHLTHLRRLHLARTGLDDEGLAHLGKIERLEWLDVHLNPITDTGAAHIARLKNLKYLNLEETSITDKGMCSLIALKELRTLSLRDTDVTDDGVRQVQALPKLRSLNLRMRLIDAPRVSSVFPFPNQTRVTEECVADLRKKAPQLRIRW